MNVKGAIDQTNQNLINQSPKCKEETIYQTSSCAVLNMLK